MSKKPLSRKYVEEYDSDDGFVEDARKSKKLKSEPKQRSLGVQKDDEGNEYWELSGKRRVQVSEFKGNTMVGIREFYEQNGKMLPGKKGVSMTIEQYTTFIELIPEIERVLKSKGVKVPRPKFDGSSTAMDEDDEEPDDDGDGAREGGSASKRRLDSPRTKRNHEATSDEDEE